jgi:hypothetical protein
MHLSFPPYVLHSLPISVFLIKYRQCIIILASWPTFYYLEHLNYKAKVVFFIKCVSFFYRLSQNISLQYIQCVPQHVWRTSTGNWLPENKKQSIKTVPNFSR